MPFSLLPRTILETRSSLSGPIKIVEQLGQYRLYVGAMLQSGGLLEGVWKKVLSNIESPVAKVLILGLGGGTVAKQIAVKWPGVKIAGIEIDPVIIKLGKKYFGLEQIPGLEIINADAVDWVKKAARERDKFDLVIVDTYLEDKMPKNCQSEAFASTVKRLLPKNGVAVFNQLLVKGKHQQAQKAAENLKKIFPQTKLLPTATNLLILGYF
jgi:spermidine synthase